MTYVLKFRSISHHRFFAGLHEDQSHRALSDDLLSGEDRYSLNVVVEVHCKTDMVSTCFTIVPGSGGQDALGENLARGSHPSEVFGVLGMSLDQSFKVHPFVQFTHLKPPQVCMSTCAKYRPEIGHCSHLPNSRVPSKLQILDFLPEPL